MYAHGCVYVCVCVHSCNSLCMCIIIDACTCMSVYVLICDICMHLYFTVIPYCVFVTVHHTDYRYFRG